MTEMVRSIETDGDLADVVLAARTQARGSTRALSDRPHVESTCCWCDPVVKLAPCDPLTSFRRAGELMRVVSARSFPLAAYSTAVVVFHVEPSRSESYVMEHSVEHLFRASVRSHAAEHAASGAMCWCRIVAEYDDESEPVDQLRPSDPDE